MIRQLFCSNRSVSAVSLSLEVDLRVLTESHLMCGSCTTRVCDAISTVVIHKGERLSDSVL